MPFLLEAPMLAIACLAQRLQEIRGGRREPSVLEAVVPEIKPTLVASMADAERMVITPPSAP